MVGIKLGDQANRLALDQNSTCSSLESLGRKEQLNLQRENREAEALFMEILETVELIRAAGYLQLHNLNGLDVGARRQQSTEDTETQQYSTPFEAREAAYLAARVRIFSANLSGEKEVSAPKSRNIPVVAWRMITHALGKNLSSESTETTPGTRNSERSHNQILSFPAANERTVGVKKSDPTERKTYERHSQNKAVRIKSQDRDQAGAVKIMFTSALGLSSSKATLSLPVKSNGGNQSFSRDV